MAKERQPDYLAACFTRSMPPIPQVKWTDKITDLELTQEADRIPWSGEKTTVIYSPTCANRASLGFELCRTLQPCRAELRSTRVIAYTPWHT